MAITYNVISVQNNSAKVQFTDDQGMVLVKNIRMPISSKGDPTSESFVAILDAHLTAIQNELDEGLVVFSPPADTVDPVS